MTLMFLVYVALGLFAIDMPTVLLHRSAVTILMGVEIMLNSCNLALVVLSQISHNLDDQVMAFSVMVVVAAEIVAGLVLTASLFRSRRATSVDDFKLLNGQGKRMNTLVHIFGTMAVSGLPVRAVAGAFSGAPVGPLVGVLVHEVPAALPTLFTVAAQLQYGAATGITNYTGLMIVIPLVSALFLLVARQRVDAQGHWLSVLASWAVFGTGGGVPVGILGRAPEARAQAVTLWQWLPDTELQVNFGLLLDSLSISFVMLVTFAGSLIHVYPVGYMEHDPDRCRSSAYLNLSVAAVLTLVLGNSYLVLFMGWKGVELMSCLLVGFWNQVCNNALTAKKAFVMNRAGDPGLLVAMMAMFAHSGAVDFATVLGEPAGNSGGIPWATFTGMFLLLAACGKSAQSPLQA